MKVFLVLSLLCLSLSVYAQKNSEGSLPSAQSVDGPTSFGAPPKVPNALEGGGVHRVSPLSSAASTLQWSPNPYANLNWQVTGKDFILPLLLSFLLNKLDHNKANVAPLTSGFNPNNIPISAGVLLNNGTAGSPSTVGLVGDEMGNLADIIGEDSSKGEIPSDSTEGFPNFDPIGSGASEFIGATVPINSDASSISDNLSSVSAPEPSTLLFMLVMGFFPIASKYQHKGNKSL
jgi:hypothetical protein